MKRIAFFLTATVFLAGIGVSLASETASSAQAKTPTPTATATATPAVAPTIKPSPTPDDEVIKVDTELVNLNIRVIDRNNRPVNNIAQSEFKILEDGVPQEIDFFSKSEVPTNYGIVIDNSGSMRQQLDKVVEAGKVLVNTNKPDDETLIIRFVGSEKIEIEQDFTSNKGDLNDALDNMYI